MTANDVLISSGGVFADRYLIERELGHGGTAHVYLAHDQQRAEHVAVKVLRADVSETVGADRFLREIRLSQTLSHPGILAILDSGQHNGRLYFTLPHADGGTLRARLNREKQMSLDDAILVATSIGGALDHAHSRGLIHRDVKPENILFAHGRPTLGDFGIARVADGPIGERTTSIGIIRGTPSYMSPEQASGETELDGRSDLYSLACVLYEMLAGVQPFIGASAQATIAQRFVGKPRSLRTYRPALPRSVSRVIERGMSVAPSERFQTGTALAEALALAAKDPANDGSLADKARMAVIAAVCVGAIIAAIAFWART